MKKLLLLVALCAGSSNSLVGLTEHWVPKDIVKTWGHDEAWGGMQSDFTYQRVVDNKPFVIGVTLNKWDILFLLGSLHDMSDATLCRSIDPDTYYQRQTKSSCAALHIVAIFAQYADQLGGTVGDIRDIYGDYWYWYDYCEQSK